jgi:hypothetical protein
VRRCRSPTRPRALVSRASTSGRLITWSPCARRGPRRPGCTAVRLSRRLANGLGENLTTEGVDVNGAVIGERWRIGPRLVLQPTFGRIPGVTFGRRMGEPRWVKTFAWANRPGAYLRVLEPGEVWAGDPVTVQDRPAHGVTIAQAFRAYMTKPQLLPELIDGSANMMTRFGSPYLIRVERHRDQYPASAGVPDGGCERHPHMIAPTALLTAGEESGRGGSILSCGSRECAPSNQYIVGRTLDTLVWNRFSNGSMRWLFSLADSRVCAHTASPATALSSLARERSSSSKTRAREDSRRESPLTIRQPSEFPVGALGGHVVPLSTAARLCR